MPIIGLNLGKNSFRAVELDSKKDKLLLTNFGLYESPNLNLESQDPEEMKKFSSAISDFFSEVGFSSANVIVGLDEKYVFMRTIKVPAMSDKELKTSIKYEAEQYIPLPLDQVNLSFQRMEPDYTDKNKVNVQIVAAKRAILDKYVNIVRGANLVPKAIEPETLALGRALGDTKEAPVGTLILEMGYSGSIIIITYGGYVRFTRSISIGGDVITKALQQNLNLDLEQAEEYKKVYGMDPYQGDGKVYNVVKPMIDNVIMEVKRANVFFSKHNPSATIKRIIITGGTALMPELLSYLANNLDVETQLASPFRDVEISSKIESQKKSIIEQGPKYSSAVGLALRGF